MPFLTPFYPLIIALLICTNGIAGVMWIVKSSDAKSYQSQLETCKAKHQAFKDQVEAQGKLAIEKAKAKEKDNAEITEKTARAWAAALSAVRADADRRVRLAAARGASGSGVSAAGATASGIDAPTQVDLPPAERVIADCAEDTLTLIWLQDWIRKTSRP
jgi:multidrug resistance efflux pump